MKTKHLVTIVMALVAALVGVGGIVAPAAIAAPTSTKVMATKKRAIKVLAKLRVKGRAPKTGYSRDNFGAAWSDVDRNGCDTRNDILKRDLKKVKYRAGTYRCIVASGRLKSKYTRQTIHFVRGPRSADVQIDHLVALSDAWQKGAQQLTDDARRAFANDPLNLLAVDGTSNMQKSDSDAASWLPRSKGYRCTYVARQISVKAKYKLWVTKAEKTAMKRVLASCPGQKTYKSKLSVTAKTGGNTSSNSTSSKPVAPRSDGSCPSSAPIKGNQGSTDWIYHVPGGRYYNVTKAEQCFASEAAAEKAGYRASRGG